MSTNMTSRMAMAAVLSACSLPAFAQTATPQDPAQANSGIQDIIVTAQRRAESVQSTPIAITALGGDTLQERRVTAVEGLNTMVPNLNFARYAGVAQVAIRGLAFDVINPGAEGRAAIYNDNVYVSRPTAAIANFFDVERVEVLRGPQGTLYGRNATAGAINIISRDPTDQLEGFGRVTFGNYSHVQIEGAVGGPLSDTISARIAVQTVDHSGYGKNIVDGQDIDDERSRAVRAKILFKPSDTFSLKLTGDYNNRDDASGNRHAIEPHQGNPAVPPRNYALGGVFPTNMRDVAAYPVHYERNIYGLSGEAVWDFADDFTLTSVTGYRDTSVKLDVSSEGSTSLLSPQKLHEKSKQFSEELRVNADLNAVKLILGGYYFHEKIRGFTWTQFDGASARPGPPPIVSLGTPGVLYYGADFGGRVRTDAYAVFGQADIDITDQLQIVLGGRYSHERKQVDEYSIVDLATPSTGQKRSPATTYKSASFSSFDPKVTLNFKPTDDVLLFATFSQGFKSGGFALGGLTPAFRPEKLRDYEVGLKADLFDRKLRLNLAGFYYDYSNLQVTKVNGTVVTTENAANATVKGVEAEITVVPTPGVDLGVNLSYLDARFDEFFTSEPARPSLGVQSLEGNRIAQSPRYTASGNISYHWQVGSGDMRIRADVSWKDRIYFSAYNRPEISQSSYALVNGSIGYKADAGWEVSAFVRNLTNKLYRVSSTVGHVFGGYQIGGQVGDPRTYGVTLGYNF